MKNISKIILQNISFLLLMGLVISFNGCGAQEASKNLTPNQTEENIELAITSKNPHFQEVLKESTTISTSPTAYYGDTTNNEALVIDIESMSLIKRIPTDGINTYTVDAFSSDYKKVYAITRSSNSMEVINTDTLEIEKTIVLEHFPRSCAFNSILGLTLVSGKDKPMTSIIDIETDTVVATIGINCKTSPKDYGGGNATGHPFWFTEDKFALIDRANREISLYQISKVNDCWSVICLDKLKTPSSVHHIVQRGLDDMAGGIDAGDKAQNTFYAVAEGSENDTKYPVLLEIKLDNNTLCISRDVSIGDNCTKDLGTHHATFHPNGEHIYLPSNEGNVYVINYHTMQVEHVIKSGKGSGHVKFVPTRDIAVITNHKDTFVSIVDTKLHTHIKDVNVSGPSINNTILQSHTSYLSKDEKYFYAFATDNGIFYKLDLETLEGVEELYTGGTPKQGCILDW